MTEIAPSAPPTGPPRKHTVRKAFLRTVGVLLACGLTLALLIVLFALAVHPGDSTVQLSPKATAPVSTIVPGPTVTHEAPPSTPPLTANGVPVAFSWYSGSGTVTVKTAEWSAVKVSEYGTAPKGAYLILDVAITGVSGQVSSNPFYWSVRDAAGRTYDSTFMGQEPQLHSAELVAGDTSSGFVTIDVPQGPVTVLFTGPSGGTLARWAVPGA